MDQKHRKIYFLRLPVRCDNRPETWFKTFCISLIRSQTFDRLKFETLVSAKDIVTQCPPSCVSRATSFMESVSCGCPGNVNTLDQLRLLALLAQYASMVCATVRCPSDCLSHSPTAAACGGFAAVCPPGRRY